MTTVVAPRPYRSPDAVRDPVARTLAAMRGVSDGAAHQFALRIKSNLLTLMHAYRSAGKVALGQRLLADAAAALDPSRPDMGTFKDVLRRSQEADATEMEAGEIFHLTPAPSTARTWRIATETAIEAGRAKNRLLRVIEEAA